MSSRPPRGGAEPSGKPQTKFVRDLSGGVNLSTEREAIADNEAWWMEGLIPLAPGNLTVTPGPIIGALGWATAIAGETGNPSFVFTFNTGGTDYVFAVWSGSGNGYIGDINGISVVKRFAGNLTSGKTAATSWNAQGLLIIDPIGYWDWNVTFANTLTSINNSVQSIVIDDTGSGYTGVPGITFSGGGGSGAAAGAYVGIGSFLTTTPGINYKVGDVCFYNFGLGHSPDGGGPELTVTTVNATGGITGISVTNPGQGIPIGPNPASINLLGGSGSGAIGAPTWVVSEIFITNRGSGYTSAPGVVIGAAGATRAATAESTVSGSLGGTSIASYAGRAWIAQTRTVTFSDAGTYASFVGSGSTFTIQDDYLYIGITALYAANTYLYIFGPSSVDVLSNVTVTAADTAAFSRVNISASIGCTQPQSIFSYFRSVAFAGPGGFYMLSGASPELVSEQLELLIPQIDYSTQNTIVGTQVSIAGKLCAAWRIAFTDIFVQSSVASTMIVLYFRGRWFFARQALALTGSPDTLGPIFCIPPSAGSGNYTLYYFESTKHLRQGFTDPTGGYWRLRSKLYDMGKPMWTKQATRAAMGCQMGGTQSTRAGLTFTLDDEKTPTGQATTFIAGTFSGYKELIGANTQGNGMFMGFGVNGIAATNADITVIQWLAMLYNELDEWQA